MKPLLPILILCLLTGCASKPKSPTGVFGGDERARNITIAALHNAMAELQRKRPDIQWRMPHKVRLEYRKPDGYHRGAGYFIHNGKPTYAYVVGTGLMVYTDGYYGVIAHHEAKHLIANGSGPEARAASIAHARWMFRDGGEIRR